MTTAAELIKRSYYLAQVLDPREEIEGFQAEEGLHELNKIIDTWGSLPPYIPSYTEETISVVANTYSYDVTPAIISGNEGHLIDANNVQRPITFIDLQRFNTLNLTLSATEPTRPYYVFIKNNFPDWATKSQVIFYPVPDDSYTATLYVMKRLANVTYSDDLSTVPNYWTAAFEFELANSLIDIYGTIPTARFYKNYDDAMDKLKAANKRDRSVQVQNVFKQIRRFRPWGVYAD